MKEKGNFDKALPGVRPTLMNKLSPEALGGRCSCSLGPQSHKDLQDCLLLSHKEKKLKLIKIPMPFYLKNVLNKIIFTVEYVITLICLV